MHRLLIVSVILAVFLLPRREQDTYYTECPTNTNDTIGKVILFLTELPLDIRPVSVINASHCKTDVATYVCIYRVVSENAFPLYSRFFHYCE